MHLSDDLKHKYVIKKAKAQKICERANTSSQDSMYIICDLLQSLQPYF